MRVSTRRRWDSLVNQPTVSSMLTCTAQLLQHRPPLAAAAPHGPQARLPCVLLVRASSGAADAAGDHHCWQRGCLGKFKKKRKTRARSKVGRADGWRAHHPRPLTFNVVALPPQTRICL
jgi:hypothetical protein